LALGRAASRAASDVFVRATEVRLRVDIASTAEASESIPVPPMMRVCGRIKERVANMILAARRDESSGIPIIEIVQTEI
jgi:hypothetical protein